MAPRTTPQFRVLPNGTLDFGFNGLERAARNFDIGTALRLGEFYRTGCLTIIAHGEMTSSAGAQFVVLDDQGKSREYSAREMARLVNPYLKDLENPCVLLLTCYGAAGTRPLARELAQALGVPVRAPSRKTNMSGEPNLTKDDWIIPAVERHSPLEDDGEIDPLAEVKNKHVWVDYDPRGGAVALVQVFAFGSIAENGPRHGFTDPDESVEVQYARGVELSGL